MRKFTLCSTANRAAAPRATPFTSASVPTKRITTTRSDRFRGWQILSLAAGFPICAFRVTLSTVVSHLYKVAFVQAPMLSALRKSDGSQVTAWTESKANAPFACPECKSDVTLRKGRFVIHHFAHKPPVTCRYGVGETEAHRKCKMEIFEKLSSHPAATKVGLERGMGTVRPDVRACINGIYVAIEVQLSALSIESIIYRTQQYHLKGMHVLWLAQRTDALNEEQYSIRPWEKWVHAACFGRVYYWLQDLTVMPYHFEAAYRSIPSEELYDGGHEVSVGGGARRLKRYRIPVPGARWT